MNIKYIYFLVIALPLIFCGCNNKTNVYENLVLVDTLLEREQVDSAQKVMKCINMPKSTTDTYSQAYYNLLATRIDYILYKPITSDSLISQCAETFKKLNDLNKLALSYYYKGAILYDLRKRQKAVLAFKECEALITSTKNPKLESRLYRHLSIVNSETGEYKLALRYAQKSFALIGKTNLHSEKVDIYNRMACCFSNLSQNDSACFYINKCIPLLKYIKRDKGICVFLDNIGYFNMDSNPQLALKYLNMAMDIAPSVDTYDNLARIYAKQGKIEKADNLWAKALTTKDLYKKATFLSAMLKQRQEEGNIHKVYQLSTWLVNLKDSIEEQKQDESIKDLQVKFDEQIKKVENERTIFKLACIICVLILSIIIIWLKRTKTQKVLVEKENDLLRKEKSIESYKTKLQDMETTGNADKKLINRLKRQIERQKKLQEKHDLRRHLLYETAIKGEDIKDWNKADCNSFLDYYISVDLKFSLYLEENEQLSVKQKVILILRHEGFSDYKIKEMMGLNNHAYNNQKYQINKIYPNEEKPF